MKKITAKELKELIKEVSQMENPITVMVWGPPGIGKSYTVEETAKELGRVFIPWSLGRKEKYDVSGIPGKRVLKDKDQEEREYTTWSIPIEWRKVFEAEGKAIVLFDEFTVAEENVQNAVLDIVLQKRVDIIELPKNTMFVLCGNLGGEDGTFATTITTALSGGRGIVCEATPPSVKEWIEYENAHKGVYAGIASFLQAEPGHLWVGPKLDKPHEPWSCPRSWSQLNKIIKELKLEEATDKLLKYAEGLLSGSTYVKFLDFINKNLISIDQLLAFNKAEWSRYFGIDVIHRSSILREIWDKIKASPKWGNHKERGAIIALLQKLVDKLVEGKETNENMMVFFQTVSEDFIEFLIEVKVNGKQVGLIYDELKKKGKKK